MHPDGTPRQHEARQPDDFPPPLQPGACGLGAGECGDAIWECSAQPGGLTGAGERRDDGAAPQPRGRDENVVRGGRFIDLVERRRGGTPRADG